jgi:hypothetical protein
MAENIIKYNAFIEDSEVYNKFRKTCIIIPDNFVKR